MRDNHDFKDWYDYRRRRTPANCAHLSTRRKRHPGRVIVSCNDCGSVVRDARTRGRKISKTLAA